MPAAEGTKATLLARIGASRAALEAVVAGVARGAMERAAADGWSVRDHLAHVTAWERSLLALLRGQSRAAAVGLSDEEEAALDTDAINARIAAAARSLSLDEVVAQFHESHREVLGVLAPMTDADFALPYSHYQPNDPPYNGQPVIGWVAGNTFEHYGEHTGWLKAAALSNEPR